MTRLVALCFLPVMVCAQYASSDDGTIVYFSGPALQLNGSAYGWRLFAWDGGAPNAVTDAPAGEFLYLKALASDGRRLLIWRPTGWQVLQHGGGDRPLFSLPGGAVAMSRNGRWLASIEPHAAVRWELTEAGARPAGRLEGTLLQPPPHGEAFVGNDGTVNLQCDGGSSCAWDGQQTVALPAFFPPGGVGPYLYHWNNTSLQEPRQQEIEQYDWRSRKSVRLPARCAKRVQNFYSPSGVLQLTSYLSTASMGATDPEGRRVVMGCGGRSAVLDSVSGLEQALPAEAVLDTTLTRVLSRPAADRFAWVPVDAAVAPVGRFENVAVTGPVTAYGLLTAVSDPDFSFTWGGQAIPWLRGSGGYSYAPLPADLVAGVPDAVVIQSSSRPWWNATVVVEGRPVTPTAVPMFHGDPAVLLQHGDYRGFVTETSPAKRGDYLHLLISGVPPGSTADAAMLATFASGSGRSTVSLPVVAVSPTVYHPAITQVTVRIPEEAVDLPVRGVVANFSLGMGLPDGQAAAGFSATAYLKY